MTLEIISSNENNNSDSDRWFKFVYNTNILNTIKLYLDNLFFLRKYYLLVEMNN